MFKHGLRWQPVVRNLGSVLLAIRNDQSPITRKQRNPRALATASVCSFVSATTFAVFQLVTTLANSRLCGRSPAVKSNPRSDALSLSAASVSNILTNVSRSVIALIRKVLMTLSCTLLFLRRCSKAGSRCGEIASCSALMAIVDVKAAILVETK